MQIKSTHADAMVFSSTRSTSNASDKEFAQMVASVLNDGTSVNEVSAQLAGPAGGQTPRTAGTSSKP